ncbi:MAG: Lrp/AsnC family transcriptional regulator [Chloroflexota bacterium]
MMNSKLDERLIQLLQEDGRQSSNVLAKKLGVSSATVRRRIKRLVQAGLLRIVGLVDPDKAGLPFTAIIALDVSHDRLDNALKSLASRPEVIWVCATTGRFDVIAIAHFPTSADFSNFLREELARIDGLKDSETFLCLHTEKGRYQYL